MPRTKSRANKQKSIAVQTDNTDSNDEIAHLQEQLKILQLEIYTLRTNSHDNSNSLKNASDKIKKDVLQDSQMVNESLKETPQILKNVKASAKQKTCGCRGQCASKQCGCVKNNRKCESSCKCNKETCLNQELENKENVRDLQNVHTRIKTEHQHLFSPASTGNEPTLNNIQFEEISFDSKKILMYTSDEEAVSKVTEKNDASKKRKEDKNEQKGTGESLLNEDDNKQSASSEADTSFDPMKPKYQLPRTPPRGNTEHVTHITPSFTEGEENEVKIKQSVDTIPDELNQENVNLEELRIELISCIKCKRKFYPWRIEVHKSACHKL